MTIRRTLGLGIVGALTLSSTVWSAAAHADGKKPAHKTSPTPAADPAAADADAAPASTPTTAPPSSAVEKTDPAAQPDVSAAPAGSPATAPPAPPTPASVFPAWTLTPYGYVRVKGLLMQTDPNVAFVGRVNGFQLQYARVGVRAQLGDRIRAEFSMDGAVDDRQQINDPNGTLTVGLRDAFIDVRTAGNIYLRAGHFLATFDPEEMRNVTERPFIDRSVESSGVLPTLGYAQGGLYPDRSLGIALRLDPEVPKIGVAAGFEFAAQNGAPEFATENDNNDLALSLTGIVRTAGDGYFIAGVRYNPRTIGDLPFRQDETDYQATAGGEIPISVVRIGFGGILQTTTFATTGGPNQNSYGAHAQFMVDVLHDDEKDVQVGYRFSIFDPSDLVLTDRVMVHTVGAVLALPRWHMRVQLNVSVPLEQADRQLQNDRIEGALEVKL